ncbi:MAG: hypothetical protein ACP5E9_01360 [Candidatus Methanospirareceae archaeon]
MAFLGILIILPFRLHRFFCRLSAAPSSPLHSKAALLGAARGKIQGSAEACKSASSSASSSGAITARTMKKKSGRALKQAQKWGFFLKKGSVVRKGSYSNLFWYRFLFK